MNKTAVMVVTAAILVSGLVIVSALGSSANAYAQSGKEAKVEIVKNAANMKDKAFSPSPLNVQLGTKVTWTNSDSALHTVTSGKGTADNVFDSKSLAPKKSFSFTFTKEGTFDYFACCTRRWSAR
jgi:plastocyanin